MGRNYLKGPDGDRINAVLAAAGYNFSLLLRWFEETIKPLVADPLLAPSWRPASLKISIQETFFTSQLIYFAKFIAARRPGAPLDEHPVLLTFSFFKLEPVLN